MDHNEKDNALKRNTRDIIFREGFACKENLPKIYHALFPDDPDWENHRYDRIDISTLIENTYRNDLALLVTRKNGFDRMVSLECQSTWKKQDLTRFGNYVFLSNAKALETKIDYNPALVENYLFILYTGREYILKRKYSLYGNITACPDQACLVRKLPVSILSPRNGHVPKSEVFDEYVTCCELFQEAVSRRGRTKEALELFADLCLEQKIYPEIFKNKKKEVFNDFMSIFSQEKIFAEMEQKNKILRSKYEAVSSENKTLNSKFKAVSSENKSLNQRINDLTTKFQEKSKAQEEEIKALKAQLALKEEK